MTEKDFEFLRALLKRRSGLALGVEKRYLIESRLTPICQRHGLTSLPDLVKRLKGRPDAALEQAVVEAMTTNETFFFRDRTPFDLFREVLLPRRLSALGTPRRLRIWCAAASTGQEPYSLAMLLKEAGPKLAGWQVEIVATDISTEVIGKARAGIYSQFEVQRGLPINLLMKYFTQVPEGWRIAAPIRAMVDFKPLNLMQSFGPLGRFDVIYCRNVLIYFDAPTKADVLRRLGQALNPGGAVLLGAAETVIGLTDALVPSAAHRGLYVEAAAGEPATPPLRAAASR